MQEQDAVALTDALTTEEKVSLLAGAATWLGTAVPRLSIPALKLCDGPNAARGDAMQGVAAASFPVGSAMAATWNPPLIEEVGAALGAEAITKDVQVLLGPTMNLHRHPLGGRHFECYSEDPLLTGLTACAWIRGVQSQGVAACAKHFVANDSEFERHTINSVVDERTLRELYLRPFEMAVRDAQVWTLMSAYNRINGPYASSHKELMVDVLKSEWGFDGFVVSDWGAALETEANMNGGLDLEMPGPTRSRGKRLIAAIDQGHVPMAQIDDSVRRILRITARTGKFESPDKPEEAIDLPEHRALARQSAAEAMVLLKNADLDTGLNAHSNNPKLLPLAPEEVKTLAVIGPNAQHGQIQGGGSSAVFPHYQIMPLEGLRDHFPNLIYEPGCRNHKYIPNPEPGCLTNPTTGTSGVHLKLFDNLDHLGSPLRERQLSARPSPWGFIPLGLPGREDAPSDSTGFSAILETNFLAPTTGNYTVGALSAGKLRLYWNDEELIDNWTKQSPGDAFFGSGSAEQRATVQLEAATSYRLRFEFQSDGKHFLQGIRFGIMANGATDLLQAAIEAATKADAVIVVAGSNSDWETEGNDRQDLSLPGDQDNLITAVAAANPNTIVVLNTGAPVSMPWLDQVPAVLQAWLPGQEFGNALTDVITGQVDASGRLPTTFPKRVSDTPSHSSYPGTNGRVEYEEGLFMGYRGFQAQNKTPLFAFGHGLSYSNWSIDNLEVDASGPNRQIQVKVDLHNQGQRAAQQTLQIYVADATGAIDQPLLALATFQKVGLAAGQSTQVALTVTSEALRYWDATAHAWTYPSGQYVVHIGFASDNLPLQQAVQLVDQS